MEFKEKQGKSLKYIAAEPDEYDPSNKYPMIILLHGFGTHMGDLAGLASAIDPNGYVYIFPNAPIPVQIGFGMTGYAWTPITHQRTTQDVQNADEALSTLFSEVMNQYGVEPGNVVLGGFSQGGMMTYRSGLPNPTMFRGLIALSARIPDPEDLSARLPETRDQPIFVSHGTMDSMLSIEDGRHSRKFLESHGYKPVYNEYRMGHEINQDVLNDLVPWIHGVLPPYQVEAY